MPFEELPPPEPKETVSYSLPVSVVRAIEYRAYLDRSNKSEALARLIRVGLIGLQQESPTDERRSA